MRYLRLKVLTDWRVTLVGAVMLGLLYALMPDAEGEVLFQLVAWGSVGTFVVNGWRRRILSTSWVLISVGWASFALGDLLFALYEYVFDTDGFPSPADLFYVGGYPFIAVGLASLVRRSRPDGDRIALIDAGIIVIPAVVVMWLYLIQPNAVGSSSPMLDRIVSSAYPAGDLLCLIVLVRLVMGPAVTRKASHPALMLLVIGLAAMLVADTWFAAAELYGAYAPGGWNDALYVVPYVTLAAAAAHPSIQHIGDPVPSSDPSLGTRRLVLLAGAALVTPVILAVRWVADTDLAVPLIVVGTAASFLLVVARMSGIVDALEVSRAQLTHDATHDPLTGLPNRGLFLRRLDDHLAAGEGGTLLFVDLDRFKLINDRFGHQAGDDVLVTVARRMVDTLRDTDQLSRLAGDEFAVLLPGASQMKAYFVAERILHALRFTVDLEDERSGEISASIGMVTWQRGDRRTGKQLLNDADRAMYVAKAGNGDQLATDAVLG